MLPRMWRKGCPQTLVGGNVNWCSHCGKQYGSFSKKLQVELPYDPAIILLGIYLINKKKKTIIWKDTCTPIFIASYLQLPRYEIIINVHHRWMDKKMWCVHIYTIYTQTVYKYNGRLLNHKKKNEILPLTAKWVTLGSIILSEIT